MQRVIAFIYDHDRTAPPIRLTYVGTLLKAARHGHWIRPG